MDLIIINPWPSSPHQIAHNKRSIVSPKSSDVTNRHDDVENGDDDDHSMM